MVLLEDKHLLKIIRQSGGRVDMASLAWNLGADERDIFASVERLVHAGLLVESEDRSGMVAA